MFQYKYRVLMCTNAFKHTMRSLTCAQLIHIITLLDASTSGHQIHQLTGLGIGTISRVRSQYCSELSRHVAAVLKAKGGYTKY